MSGIGFLKRVFHISGKYRGPARIAAVEELIGYHFRDPQLLELALTHRSYSRAGESKRQSNERLEYLGDSVLGLAIADRLYRDHPRLREGELTKIKAMLVNESTLASIAKQLGLNQHILLSPEEQNLGGHERASIVSDTFESIIGAVYLDGGYAASARMVDDLIYAHKELVQQDTSQRNYKGELLELMQSRGMGMPRYDVISESGPDHDKQFSIVVYLADSEAGFGTGHTKKEAEQKAAAMALDRLTNNCV